MTQYRPLEGSASVFTALGACLWIDKPPAAPLGSPSKSLNGEDFQPSFSVSPLAIRSSRTASAFKLDRPLVRPQRLGERIARSTPRVAGLSSQPCGSRAGLPGLGSWGRTGRLHLATHTIRHRIAAVRANRPRFRQRTNRRSRQELVQVKNRCEANAQSTPDQKRPPIRDVKQMTGADRNHAERHQEIGDQ